MNPGRMDPCGLAAHLVLAGCGIQETAGSTTRSSSAGAATRVTHALLNRTA